jgi:hypothetical protein
VRGDPVEPIQPAFDGQPPNSDANSRLEAEGSGLPERTTVVVVVAGALAVVEVAANSLRLAVVVAGPWRRAAANSRCGGRRTRVRRTGAVAVDRPDATAARTGAGLATLAGCTARAASCGSVSAAPFTTAAPPPAIAAADAAIAASLPVEVASVAA